MGQRNFKAGEQIEILYQAPGKQSGLSGIVTEIYLPTNAKDLVNFPDVAMVEIGATGTYRGVFTPDAQGEWKTMSHLSDGSAQVISRYSVGGYDVHSVGQQIAAVDTAVLTVAAAVATVDGKVSALQTPPMAV